MRRFVGLMSGTSADGVDAALLVRDGGSGAAWRLEAFRSEPYTRERRERIVDAMTAGTARLLTGLHVDLAEWFAEAVEGLLAEAGVEAGAVEAVGSHGQTVWHRPPEAGTRGATLQLGDPATLAARTGIPVVSDFRSADVAAGGQGAPLVPWPDRELFSLPDRSRVILNVGGMANLTWLPPRGSPEPLVAFDTGPGNVLLDAAAERASGGRDRFDVDGRRAASGTVDPDLLEELAGDPFFQLRPPRSTGRERFGPALVDALVRRRGLVTGDDAGWADLLATLTALTAETVAGAVARWVRPRPLDEVVVAGGGARNPALVEALGRALLRRGVEVPVRTGAAALGMDPDAREAAAFAVLAWAHLDDVAANAPEATGAAGPRVLGSFTPAPGRVGADRRGP